MGIRQAFWIFVIVFIDLFVSPQCGHAASSLKLPHLPSETWYVTQGNNGTASHTGNLQYAWDFNHTNDYLRPVIIPASGKVIYTYSENGANEGWGNVVIVEYNDGTFGKLAHLDRVFVRVGQRITQGQVVGLCGNTGTVGAHIHYQTQNSGLLNGQSIPSSFSDVATNGGVPLGCDCDIDDKNHQYTSQNSTLFDNVYNYYGQNLIGIKKGPLHWYYDWDNTNLYDSNRNNVPNNIYIQDLTGGLYQDGAIVYDALGGARKAYLIRSGFWREWSKDSWELQQGGPKSKLGAPITEEYPISSSPPQSRQDFQRGYLIYTQGANQEITPTISKMPGIYDDGWHPDTSYAFAEAYANNGARKTVGEPDTNLNETPYVHEWCVSSACVTIQDFWSGSYGDNAIVLNKKQNKAYNIHEEFWILYRDNNGHTTLGMPLEDAHPPILNSTPLYPCMETMVACQTFERAVLMWDGSAITMMCLASSTSQQKKLFKVSAASTTIPMCPMPVYPSPPVNLR